MKYIIIIIFFICLLGNMQAHIRSGEKKVNLNNYKDAIVVYATFVDLLRTEYIKNENNLVSNDKNFFQIRKMISRLLDESKHNLNPSLIEPYAASLGSVQFVNDYKALFVFLFDFKHLLTACPDEVTYYIDASGRITYLEARGIFKEDDKQVFDRDLLKRFSITRKKFKSQYNRNL